MQVRSGCAWLVGLLLGCAAADSREVVELPTVHTVVREQLVVSSDFPLARHHRLLDEIVGQRHDVAERLALPLSDEPIYIYLFEDPARYESYIRRYFPSLPGRRAFFVESDTRLAVYAHWGDRVAEDLRHEVTHGYLHAVVPNLPLWLDEGLAEYFEVGRGQHGWHQPHLDLLYDRFRRYEWTPGLERLQHLQQMTEMKQIDYAESWLWVHFLLETTNDRRALLQNYLARIRMTAESPPLVNYLRELNPNYALDVVEHLERMRRGEGRGRKVAPRSDG